MAKKKAPIDLVEGVKMPLPEPPDDAPFDSTLEKMLERERDPEHVRMVEHAKNVAKHLKMAKRSRNKWRDADPSGDPTRIKLQETELPRAEHALTEADREYRRVRGDSEDHEAAVTDGAPKPLGRQRAEEEAIIKAIRAAGYAPQCIPIDKGGKRDGLKAKIRETVTANHPDLFQKTSTVFGKAWDRLRGGGEIIPETKVVSTSSPKLG